MNPIYLRKAVLAVAEFMLQDQLQHPPVVNSFTYLMNTVSDPAGVVRFSFHIWRQFFPRWSYLAGNGWKHNENCLDTWWFKSLLAWGSCCENVTYPNPWISGIHSIARQKRKHHCLKPGAGERWIAISSLIAGGAVMLPCPGSLTQLNASVLLNVISQVPTTFSFGLSKQLTYPV